MDICQCQLLSHFIIIKKIKYALMFYIKEGSKNRLVAKSLSHESKQRRDISQELVLDTKKTENSSNSRLVHANRSLNNSSKFCAIASHDVPAVMLNVCSKID